MERIEQNIMEHEHMLRAKNTSATCYHICNSRGRTVKTKYSAQEARDYLISKGAGLTTGIKRGWFIREERNVRIVAQAVIDNDTGKQVNIWVWNCDYTDPSINYATQEVEYLNTLVGRGRYKLVDILATVH